MNRTRFTCRLCGWLLPAGVLLAWLLWEQMTWFTPTERDRQPWSRDSAYETKQACEDALQGELRKFKPISTQHGRDYVIITYPNGTGVRMTWECWPDTITPHK